jgi:hypothetical protein
MSKIIMTKFPSHFIANRAKDEEWGLKFCKAIWDDYNITGNLSFYSDRASYSRYMSYALGRQSVVKYQDLLKSDESDDLTFLNIDWTPLPIFTKFREIALARVKQVDYNVSANPVDPAAKVEESKDKALQAAKIIGREILSNIDPSAVEGTKLQKTEGEFDDLDELEVLHNTTYKFAAASQVEEAIEFVLGYNDFEETRAEVKRCIFDYGIGGLKEYVDENGIVKVRAINPSNIVISKCERRDFKDARYVGEVLSMSVQDIAAAASHEFTKAELLKIEEQASNKYAASSRSASTGTIYQREKEDFQVDVLEVEWISVNEYIIETGQDKRGNAVASRSNRKRAAKKQGLNHKTARYKTVYTAKWIIGTEFMWDFKESNYMKRNKLELQETSMSFHLFAPQFDPLTSRISSRVDQAIPVIDALHLAWFRLQGVIANARPKGISIEVGSLEDVDLGVGQNQFTPYDIIDLYNKTGNLVYRRKDDNGVQSNYLPINELQNGIGDEASQYYALIQQNIQLLRDITGLNEVSEGFSGERTTNDVAALANQNSNNALHGIIEADQSLLKRLYEGVLLRLGSVFAAPKDVINPMYARALGKDTVSFIKSMKNSTSYSYGIIMENKPDAMERQRLVAKLDQFAGAGLLEPQDIFLVENTPSLKTAQVIIGYKIKKRKEAQQQQAQQEQQMAGQMQQQQMQMQMQMDQQRIQMETQAKLEIERLKGEFAVQVAQIQAGAKSSEANIKSSSAINKASLDNRSREKQTAASLMSAEKQAAQKEGQRSQNQKISDRTRNQSNTK